jgi:Domain of unknown function (DUF3854)
MTSTHTPRLEWASRLEDRINDAVHMRNRPLNSSQALAINSAAPPVAGSQPNTSAFASLHYRDLLHAAHTAKLRQSSIGLDIAEIRGYSSLGVDEVARRWLRENHFRASTAPLPAMVIPVWSLEGMVAYHQLRPDAPAPGRDDRPIKYPVPRKQRFRIDVHPQMLSLVMDPSIPLTVTEGILKADALVSQGEAAVGLQGCWGWMQDARPLDDWRSLPLAERDVSVIFDSDVGTNLNVRMAATRLYELLGELGAHPEIKAIPQAAGSPKVGIDDFLYAGGKLSELEPLPSPDPTVMQRAQDILREDFTGATLDVALAILREADTQSSFAPVISDDRLARASGRSVATVKYAKARLRDHDLFRVYLKRLSKEEWISAYGLNVSQLMQPEDRNEEQDS